MAIIQKIRDKYAKLAGGVIVVALIGFILTDLGKGGFSRSTTVGKVDGEKIDYTDFEAAVRAKEEEVKRNNPNANIDDNQQAQLREQAWNDLVSSRLMNEINEKLGITVGKSEMNDLISGPNPDPAIKQAFTNPQTGEFNPQAVAAQVAQIKKSPDGKAQWEAFEADLVKRRYTSKFNALVAGSVYTPKFILDDQDKARNEVAKFNYVKLPYSLIPDAEVKVSDDDIKKYMESHKKMFTITQPNRSVDYVAFNIVPSAEDSTKTLTEIEGLRTELGTTTDLESFVNRNSQQQIPVDYFTKEQLQGISRAEELTTAPVNTIVGPFFDNGSVMIAKVVDRKSFPDSVSARHILVSMQAQEGQTPLTEEQAKARIDSVVAMVNGGVSFDTLAARFSDDPGSKNNGGKYDFPLAQKQGLAKEFGDFVFEGHAGEKKIVKTDFGFHYIEILKTGAPVPSTKLALVAKMLNVSDATSNGLYTLATNFTNKAKNAASFDKEAKEKNLNVQSADGLQRSSFVVNGVGSSRDLVKWAYDAKMGDVSPVYIINQKYVVAKLSNIMDKGLAPINDKTRPILINYVRNIKKAELLKAKVKGQNTLEAIAQGQNQTVAVADSVNFMQNGINGLGNEPKVLGLAFAKSLKENTLSPAVSGSEGVYFINVVSRTNVPAAGPRDLNMERQMNDYQVKGGAANMIINGIRESADVTDTRYKLY